MDWGLLLDPLEVVRLVLLHHLRRVPLGFLQGGEVLDAEDEPVLVVLVGAEDLEQPVVPLDCLAQDDRGMGRFLGLVPLS